MGFHTGHMGFFFFQVAACMIDKILKSLRDGFFAFSSEGPRHVGDVGP